VGVDTVMVRVMGSAVAWYLTDYQNSMTTMADNTGAVQDRITSVSRTNLPPCI
jgi:hypothetical protein